METCLHKILVDRDVEGAISYSKEVSFVAGPVD